MNDISRGATLPARLSVAGVLLAAVCLGLGMNLPARAEPGVPGAPSQEHRDIERQRQVLRNAGRQAVRDRELPGKGRNIEPVQPGDPLAGEAPLQPAPVNPDGLAAANAQQPAGAPANPPAAPQANPGAAPGAPAPAHAPASPAVPGAAPGAPTQPALPSDGPRVEWENPSHDWGTVMDTKPLVCTFKFKNVGNQKLVIGNINTGCGCTVANLATKEFEPGEGSQIDITFSPKGSGKQQRAVTVQTNDPRSPNAQLVIAANVVPLVEARPNNVQFGQVSVGEQRTVEIVIVSRDPKLDLEGISVNGPEVSAVKVDRAPAAMIEPELPGRIVIDVTLKEGAPVGRLLRLVTVNVKASANPQEEPKPHELRINAFASIQGELAIEPAFVRVHPLQAGEEFEREITVTRTGGKPFKLDKVEIANANIQGVSASFEPAKIGSEDGYKIKLKGKAGESANNFRGSIVLYTDLEREKTTEVQFSGIVRVTAPTASALPPSPTGPHAPPKP